LSATEKPAVLVIGVGNPLRGDDGAGAAVIQRLQNRLPASVATLQMDSDGVSLMEAWRGFERVILVDAACSGAAPDAIHRFDASRTELPRGLFHYSSHLFGVAEAVELARQLGRLPKRLVVYGIEGAVFTYGEGLSAAVAAAVEQVASAIAIELE
jgi:hydrogenase maturation protease